MQVPFLHLFYINRLMIGYWMTYYQHERVVSSDISTINSEYVRNKYSRFFRSHFERERETKGKRERNDELTLGAPVLSVAVNSARNYWRLLGRPFDEHSKPGTKRASARREFFRFYFIRSVAATPHWGVRAILRRENRVRRTIREYTRASATRYFARSCNPHDRESH